MKTKEEIEKEIEIHKTTIDSIKSAMKTREYSLRSHEIQIQALEKELAAIEKKSERWKPEYNQRYFVADGTKTDDFNYNNDNFDKNYYDSFNMFQTPEEAQKEADTTLVWRELRAFAKEWNKGMGTYTIEYYGVKFSNIGHVGRELRDKFGDRLKLLDF